MDRQKRDEIAAAASFWDARLRAPDCSEQDRETFATWRDADPAHREGFDRLQAIVSTLRRERSQAHLRAMRDAALAAADRRPMRARWLVASVAGVALAVLAWTIQPHLAALDWNATTFSTSTGQRSTVTLQDGSTVELNSQTRIRVKFSQARRSITLLDGQAIFQVAKDRQRPFVVRAGDREIVAVGTAFDVQLDSSAVRVTLLEGKVAVTAQGGAAAQTSGANTDDEPGAGSNAVYLSAGQQLIVSRNAAEATAATPEVREIDVSKVTSWRAGQIFFEDLLLAQAVAEMNKHSVIQITLDDPSLVDLRINGMFRAGEQQGFARALEEYFPIVAERRDETQIVLKPRR